MSKTRPETGSSDGISARSRASEVDVAAGVEHVGRGRRVEPGREVGADAASGRVDDDEVGSGGEPGRRRVTDDEGGDRRGCRPRGIRVQPCRRPRGVDRVGGGLDADDRSTRRRQVPGEPAHAAVQVPHRGGVGVVDPVVGLAVEGGGHRGVGLEERPRAEQQRGVADPHRQQGLLGERDLGLALEHGLVLRVEVRGDHAHRGQVGQQAGQRGAQVGEVAVRAQHEPHEVLAVGGVRDDEVLQLAASRRHVVRLEAQVGDEAVQGVEGGRQARLVEATAAQVDAAPTLVEDAEGRVSGAAPDHQLGLVPVVRRGAAGRVEPLQPGSDVGQCDGGPVLLGGQLLVVGRAHQGARAAPAGVEVVALHGAASVGALPRDATARHGVGGRA